MSIRISRRSATLIAVIGAYQTLLERARQAVTDLKGKVAEDKPDEGLILAKWTTVLSFSGLRVRLTFRVEDSQTISIDGYGYFADAFDTFGAASRKAAEVIDRLVELLVDQDGASLDQEVPAHHGPPPAGPAATDPTLGGPVLAGPVMAGPAGAPYPGQPAAVMAAGASPVAIGHQTQPGANHRGTAFGSFILGLVGLIIPLVGIVAIVFAGMSLTGMARTGNNHGKGLAITGLVLGIVTVILGTLIWGAMLSG